jgi:hypothetical protein
MVERELQGKHQRKARGVRKFEREQKALERRKYLPSESQILKMQTRAMQGLEELDLELLTYITPDNKDQTITSHDAQTSARFAECVFRKINEDLYCNDGRPYFGVPRLGEIALQFVERMWLESALELIKRDEKTTVLVEFLAMCDDTVQAYLKEESPASNLSRLQETRNKVISPITGRLDVK